ncbi:MAG: hypothetical protein KDF65_04330 [Anaerolineae bacterium]|nr:hypothetical protein [Anaerolineae bacterium]
MTTAEYLAEIHLMLVNNPIVANYTVVRQRLTSQSGYLRVRIDLANGDFLEAAEFFHLTLTDIEVGDYHHQWMDDTRTVLQKRWDSTPHYPHLENAPHHCHDGSEENVIPSRPLGIQEVLVVISHEIYPTDAPN